MKITIKVQFKDDMVNVIEQKTFKDNTTPDAWYGLSDKVRTVFIKYLAHEEWDSRGYDDCYSFINAISTYYIYLFNSLTFIFTYEIL